MHINKGNPLFARESKGNPHGTQGNPVTGLNSAEPLLLMLVTFREDVCEYAWKLQTKWDHTFVFGGEGIAQW